MNQNSSGEKELKASEEEIFDSLLDAYENSIGLPSIPKGLEFTCIKYLYMSNEDFKKMSSEDCAEACVLLNSFSFHLSRLLNKEKSKLRWCNERILKVVSGKLTEYRYFSPDERMALSIKDDDYAQKIKLLSVKIQARIDRIEYLPIRLEKISEAFSNLSYNKRKNNERNF